MRAVKQRELAVLLEREREMARLRDLVVSSGSGHGAAVVIEGPAGIGKTSLLGAAGQVAIDVGLRPLVARGGELERDFAYGVVRQLLEPTLWAAAEGERASLLRAAGLAGSVLGQPLPAQLTASSQPLGDPPIAAAMHGLYWLTVSLAAKQPLLVSVDDLHWADTASVRFLAYLAHRIADLPVLLLAATRSAAEAHDPELVETLAADPSVERLVPAPLSAEAVKQLVRAQLGTAGSEELSQECHDATRGNPFLVRSLLDALAEGGTEPRLRRRLALPEVGSRAVARSVRLRLSRLGRDAEELARAVAILGTAVDLRHAAALAGLDEAASTRAADALSAVEVLLPGSPLEFVHPIVRAAVYEQLPAADRDRRHLQAARLLDAEEVDPERLAPHLLAIAGRADAWVVATLRRAAARSMKRGAPEAAVRYLLRALEEPPMHRALTEVLLELGSAEMLTDGPAACGHLAQAERRLDDPRERAMVAELLAKALYFARRPLEAVQVGTRAIETLGGRFPELEARLRAAVLSPAIMEPSLNDLAERICARVRGEDAAVGFGDKALLGLVAYRDARACHLPRQTVTRAERALAGGELLAEDNGGAPFILAALVLALADSEAALGRFEAGLAAAHEHGSVFAFAANMVFRGRTHFLRGALIEAVSDLSAGLEAAEAYKIGIAPGWAVPYLADALMEQGDLDGAARVLERGAARGAGTSDDALSHAFLDSTARLLLLRGEHVAALEAALDCGRRFEAVGGRNPAFMPWRSQAALALIGLEHEAARARALAVEELGLARDWAAPRALGRALRVAGLTAAGDERLELLRQAVDMLASSPARLEHAHALVELGAALRRTGMRSASRAPLREALDLAHRCGSAPLADRARDELAATGARPRRPLLKGPDALTPSERRVAAMAAAGMTNREIAQALFVTPRTVEVHLTHAYQKLDIVSREQLPAALTSSGTA